jgi:ABC-type branched-subunit amino acid transport system ATPase component
LDLDGVTAGYGQARVLNGIDLKVRTGEVFAILGTNGAGKTTLADTICGTIRATGGAIHFNGNDVTKLPSHLRLRRGIAHCMEKRRIFSTLSVEENLLIAARDVGDAEQRRRLNRMFSLFPILRERRDSPGTALSGGEQQMLAIGRSLMSDPKLVVFDEISLGLAPVIMDRLYETLRDLRQSGLTMLIIEQDVDRALELADRACVLELGRIALSGLAAEIRSDPQLRRLYLGEAE